MSSRDFLEDVSVVEMHIDRFQPSYFVVKFLRCLDNTQHQFNLAKNCSAVLRQHFELYLLQFFIVVSKAMHILLQFVNAFAASSSVFLSVHVDLAQAFFGTMLNFFPYLKTLVRCGMYLSKLASACPLSHRSPSLSTFPNTSFKFDVLSIAETTETLLNGFRVLPN